MNAPFFRFSPARHRSFDANPDQKMRPRAIVAASTWIAPFVVLVTAATSVSAWAQSPTTVFRNELPDGRVVFSDKPEGSAAKISAQTYQGLSAEQRAAAETQRRELLQRAAEVDRRQTQRVAAAERQAAERERTRLAAERALAREAEDNQVRRMVGARNFPPQPYVPGFTGAGVALPGTVIPPAGGTAGGAGAGAAAGSAQGGTFIGSGFSRAGQ